MTRARARTRKRPESLEPRLFRHALPTLFTAPNRAVAQKRL
jgi:hypothetical protein